jgi:hypothetical protein
VQEVFQVGFWKGPEQGRVNDHVVGQRGERRKTMEKMRPHVGTVRTKAVKNLSCR